MIRVRALGLRKKEEVEEEGAEHKDRARERLGRYQVESVVLEVGGQPLEVDASGVVEALLQTLQKAKFKLDDVVEILLRLQVKRR